MYIFIYMCAYIHIYIWVNYNDPTDCDLTGIMVNKGKMALIQASEIFLFTHIHIYIYIFYIYMYIYFTYIYSYLHIYIYIHITFIYCR